MAGGSRPAGDVKQPGRPKVITYPKAEYPDPSKPAPPSKQKITVSYPSLDPPPAAAKVPSSSSAPPPAASPPPPVVPAQRNYHPPPSHHYPPPPPVSSYLPHHPVPHAYDAYDQQRYDYRGSGGGGPYYGGPPPPPVHAAPGHGSDYDRYPPSMPPPPPQHHYQAGPPPPARDYWQGGPPPPGPPPPSIRQPPPQDMHYRHPPPSHLPPARSPPHSSSRPLPPSHRMNDRNGRDRDGRDRDGPSGSNGNRRRDNINVRDRPPSPSSSSSSLRRRTGRDRERSRSPGPLNRRRRDPSRTPLSPSDPSDDDPRYGNSSRNGNDRSKRSSRFDQRAGGPRNDGGAPQNRGPTAGRAPSPSRRRTPSSSDSEGDPRSRDARKRARQGQDELNRAEDDKRRRIEHEQRPQGYNRDQNHHQQQQQLPRHVDNHQQHPRDKGHDGLQSDRGKLAFGIKQGSTRPGDRPQVVPEQQTSKSDLRKFFAGDEEDSTMDESQSDSHPSAPNRSPAKQHPAASAPANGRAAGHSLPPKPETRTTAIPPPPPTRPETPPSPQTQTTAIPKAAPVAVPTELYERLVQVGEGTYGKVYKARNVETGTIVGLKKIRMEAEKDGFPVTSIREIKLLQSVRHTNVIHLFEMLVSKGSVYMVFEYMEHDLTGVLNHPSIVFTQAHLKSLMQQFLEGLGFVHRRGILHRDLKGSNILISRTGELRIADFGLARFYAKNRRNDYTNRVITQWYKPPELLFGATVYGAEVDMWSAGCIFLELFARKPIFQGQDEIHQLDVIFAATGTPSVEDWPDVRDLPWYDLVKPKTTLPSALRDTFSVVESTPHSRSSASASNAVNPAHRYTLTEGALDLAERLLELNPSKRFSAQQALEMPYFVSEEPGPVVPSDLLSSVKGEWHEYESKRARRKQQKDEASAPPVPPTKASNASRRSKAQMF